MSPDSTIHAYLRVSTLEQSQPGAIQEQSAPGILSEVITVIGQAGVGVDRFATTAATEAIATGSPVNVPSDSWVAVTGGVPGDATVYVLCPTALVEAVKWVTSQVGRVIVQAEIPVTGELNVVVTVQSAPVWVVIRGIPMSAFTSSLITSGIVSVTSAKTHMLNERYMRAGMIFIEKCIII